MVEEYSMLSQVLVQNINSEKGGNIKKLNSETTSNDVRLP